MRQILSTRFIAIPKDVTITIKARTVTVKGPRGELTKTFKSRQTSMVKLSDKKIRVDIWGGSRKDLACLRTTTAHIENMITGLTKGFKYKMRFVYAHFPINGTIIADEVPSFEIRNFLGEKRVRTVKARPGVSIVKSTDVKDEIQVSGNDLNAVSLTCSDISSVTKVRKKDIRKFLDGIYVSEKGFIAEEEL
jgi:large subunit ribosomal protein L9e